MYDSDHSGPGASREESTASPSRRQFLKTGAATGIAAAGIGAGTLGALARSTDLQMINLSRGVSGWLGADTWNADGEFPVVDELFVFVHGWFGDLTARQQAGNTLEVTENAGYSPDAAVGIQWPASNVNFLGASGDTQTVGNTLAGLAEDFYDAGGGNVRLTGHSLGGRTVYWVTTKIASGYELETVVALAPAAYASEACSTWDISQACEFYNFHSENDSIVGTFYGSDSLANSGTDCDPGPNYTDVDLTSDVGSHLGHIGNPAVGEEIAAAVTDGDCSYGSGGGAASGSSGASGTSGGSDGQWGSGGSSGGSGWF